MSSCEKPGAITFEIPGKNFLQSIHAMKYILMILMLTVTASLYGQELKLSPYYYYPQPNITGRIVFKSPVDSAKFFVCKERGHSWSAPVDMDWQKPNYILDEKDTSYLVECGKSKSFDCLRCNKDSIYTDETRKVIWTRKKQ